MGVIELNQQLQAVLNPKSVDKPECRSILYTFREGDKVMQIKNNYDIIWHKDGENGTGIFNGDIGYLRAINRQGQEVIAEFDGRRATYPFEQLDQLELAYAVTVHKKSGQRISGGRHASAGRIPEAVLPESAVHSRHTSQTAADPDRLSKRHLSNGGQQPPYESIYLSAGYAGTAEAHADTSDFPV